MGKEFKIKGWIARDNDGIHLFFEKPIYTEISHEWLGFVNPRNNRDYGWFIGRTWDTSIFPDAKCGGEPIEVDITIE